MSDLPRQIAAQLEQYRLLPEDRRLVVAVSGGLDSVVLLHVLARIRSPRLDLVVAHANHGLRGAESDADAAFVETTCQNLGIRCRVGTLRVREALERSKESLEMVARRLRHRFLASTAAKEGVGTVATAHHADDQAELLLLRLLRGAGSEGLAGMTWRSPAPFQIPKARELTLIRPLLRCHRKELLRFATSEGIAFREDSSNADRTLLRNRVRHELLPLLEQEFNPGIRGVLCRTAELLGDEAEHLADEANTWRGNPDRPPFASLSPALQRWVLRQELWELGHDVGFDQLERLRRRQGVTLAPGIDLEWNSGGGFIRRESPGRFSSQRVETTLESSGTQVLGDRSVEWRLKPTRRPDPLPVGIPGWECLDAQAVGPSVFFRHWRPGDRFQMLGRKRLSKLQDLFVNRKIPAAVRRRLAIGETTAGQIFWVESLPPGELFKVTPESRRLLLIRGHDRPG
ncbi:MAG: tRNA lysidine(34) synthetase TilS [Verrucomicrobia bacterium]|nr:tRNA lysidine(34) synthetase TilS [Verrucomicrobiota bacterium]